MIVPKSARPVNSEIIAQTLRDHHIRWALFQDVPYSYLGELFPQMKKSTPFVWNEILFEPHSRFEFLPSDEGIIERLRAFASGKRHAVLWRLTYQ